MMADPTPDPKRHQFPLVRRRRLVEAERLLGIYKRKYRETWEDHLARCDCHDSWDQCPCTAKGHPKDPLPEGRSIHTCHNKCCRWCSND